MRRVSVMAVIGQVRGLIKQSVLQVLQVEADLRGRQSKWSGYTEPNSPQEVFP